MQLQTKIHRLGAQENRALLANPDAVVRVDEKVDGSQITFGVFGGQLRIRSKSQEITNHTTGMFLEGIKRIHELAPRLTPGFTYHGEYLQRVKHNVLRYERLPKDFVVVFDVVLHDGGYMPPQHIASHLAAIGAFEPVQWAADQVKNIGPGYFPKSALGGPCEGVVIKGYTSPSQRVYAKLVSDAFKETKQDTSTRNLKNPEGDLAITVANNFCTRARYAKALQYLKETGVHTGTMRDMGPLHKRVAQDLEQECEAEIKEYLWKHYRKPVMKHALRGIAPWYENLLTNDNAYWSAQRERSSELECSRCGSPDDAS